MRISIITPTFNSESVIKQNVESIIRQSYQNYEHIIIDNLSKDNTIEIITNLYKNAGLSDKLKIITEKDNGISEAFNKGIMNSSGEIITILNSDDSYISNLVFKNVINAFSERKILFTHGNIFFSDPLYGSNVRKPLLCAVQKAMPYNHPTMFFRKEVYVKYGLYDNEFKYAMDFEFICRLANKLGDLNDYSYYIVTGALVRMLAGGASWKNELNTINESKRALMKYHLWNFNAKWDFFLRKLRTRLKQLLTIFGGEKIVVRWRQRKWTN